MSRGSIVSAPWFIWRRINWTLVHSQLNHGSLWNEPRRTLKWTQGPYFRSWKNPKTKTGKAIHLKIYLIVHGQKLIFKLEIPLRAAPVSKSHKQDKLHCISQSVRCQVSGVKCQVSGVTCHRSVNYDLSPVTSHRLLTPTANSQRPSPC